MNTYYKPEVKAINWDYSVQCGQYQLADIWIMRKEFTAVSEKRRLWKATVTSTTQHPFEDFCSAPTTGAEGNN